MRGEYKRSVLFVFSFDVPIDMGAVAITTLAGSTLILHADRMGLLTEITPFLH
jgi:hypothetical protein